MKLTIIYKRIHRTSSIIKLKIKNMEPNINQNNSEDSATFRMDKKRANFKYQLFIYLTMNTFFWVLWYINFRNKDVSISSVNLFPWPLWPMVIWGSGVFYSFLELRKSVGNVNGKK